MLMGGLRGYRKRLGCKGRVLREMLREAFRIVGQ